MSLKQSPRLQSCRAIKDKGVYTEAYESDTNEKVNTGKKVLKPNKARYVRGGFEEDVKDEDVFASTTLTASVGMLLSRATDLRSEGRTVFTSRREHRHPQRTHGGW